MPTNFQGKSKPRPLWSCAVHRGGRIWPLGLALWLILKEMFCLSIQHTSDFQDSVKKKLKYILTTFNADDMLK